MARLSAYLTFNGNCREAMEFYSKGFGGKLQIMTVGESPMAAQSPPETKNMVMHSSLEKDDIRLMASDNMRGDKLVAGNTISLIITGTDIEELKSYFKALSSGGKLSQPLKQEFFGWYGSFTDKFGMNWMFQADIPKY